MFTAATHQELEISTGKLSTVDAQLLGQKVKERVAALLLYKAASRLSEEAESTFVARTCQQPNRKTEQTSAHAAHMHKTPGHPAIRGICEGSGLSPQQPVASECKRRPETCQDSTGVITFVGGKVDCYVRVNELMYWDLFLHALKFQARRVDRRLVPRGSRGGIVPCSGTMSLCHHAMPQGSSLSTRSSASAVFPRCIVSDAHPLATLPAPLSATLVARAPLTPLAPAWAKPIVRRGMRRATLSNVRRRWGVGTMKLRRPTLWTEVV